MAQSGAERGRKRPNILVVLFDDVGFSDFGCYGSAIRTPAIDRLAAGGLRYTGFHTTAMCSTTRAALLSGRNHHRVGMGCLANFDAGLPGYRGKIAREAGVLPEMLRGVGYRNYMVGKWHVTPLHETGPAGPFDGWPLGRGFDRFYGFMDAETDQYAPELIRDNSSIAPPGDFRSGYHLSADLVDQAMGFLAGHQLDAPNAPWLLWLAFGACHAPHQAPGDLIRSYDAVFEAGWDVERDRRLARQIALGIVPERTALPPRNDGVVAWDGLGADERRLFVRLQSAYAAMLDHADQQIARLMAFLAQSGLAQDTIVLVLSDNGASQEGGPLGMVNAMGPYNFQAETMAEKIRRIEDIGGPDTHSNFPHGWAMAANTPLRRYKQNTHGGGIRDPLIVCWPEQVRDPGGLRPQFCHAADLVPTLLDWVGVAAPTEIGGVAQLSMDGESFAATLKQADAPRRIKPQYFEMFGHRGLWHDGWKAVAYHPTGTAFEADIWELYHLDVDFSETRDLAAVAPERLAALQAMWWAEAERCQVLPLDDRFGPRFVESLARGRGDRRDFVFHPGVGHIPTDVAPDVRARGYEICAHVMLEAGSEGVLLAHGDATSGYVLYVEDGRLVHDMNIGGRHHVVRSERVLPVGACRLGYRAVVGPMVRFSAGPHAGMMTKTAFHEGVLLVDGVEVGRLRSESGFNTLISWSGLDVGMDRGSPVGDYASPFRFTGELQRIDVR
ncbi:MAG: arylsulfatase [Acidiphilium sp. 34-60-192]|nr:MAG: arylsulfatase [Acidiphilium sp. 34-60-192]